MDKMISVQDRLPDTEGWYLCCVKSFLFPDRTYFSILKGDKHGFREGDFYTDNVTHWLPLPEPPKEEQ